MLKIEILAVGQKMPSWLTEAYAEYAKRLQAYAQFSLIEIPSAIQSKNTPAKVILEQEGKAILSRLDPKSHCIVLAIQGKCWSTEELSQQLADWQHLGQKLSFVIGGAEGMAPAVYQRAQASWSLSKLTLPHPIARLVVTEQLYRALSLLEGHPYHRG